MKSIASLSCLRYLYHSDINQMLNTGVSTTGSKNLFSC